jgi:hypothetical protein
MLNSDDAKTCKRCGSTLPVAAPPELVENLVFGGFMQTEKGYFVRVRNTGTAPMAVDRVTLSGQRTEILGVAAGKGTFAEGIVTVPPGDETTISFKPPPEMVLVGRRQLAVHTTNGSEDSFEITWS